MIYLSLPLMYHNVKINQHLFSVFYYNNRDKENSKENKTNYFKIPQLILTSFHGCFPFSIWNGGSNLNIKNEKFLLNKDIYNFFVNIKAPIRLDCSNILIQDIDLNNGYQNLILEYGNNGSNFIEISNFGLMEYIKEKYNNYDFILSKNAHYINPFTSDIINTILEQNLFYLIELPNELKNNIELLNNIQQKDKIEITIGNKCPLNCPNLGICAQQEQEYQINYSQKTVYDTCEKMNQYTDPNQLINEINYYKKLGFNHFKIDTPPISKNIQFQYYLILNLIQNQTNQLLFLSE